MNTSSQAPLTSVSHLLSSHAAMRQLLYNFALCVSEQNRHQKGKLLAESDIEARRQGNAWVNVFISYKYT